MERTRADLGRQVRRLLLGTWGKYPWHYDMHAEGCMGLKTVKGRDIYHQNNIFSNSLNYDILVLRNKAIRGITEYSSAPYCHGTSRKGKTLNAVSDVEHTVGHWKSLISGKGEISSVITSLSLLNYMIFFQLSWDIEKCFYRRWIFHFHYWQSPPSEQVWVKLLCLGIYLICHLTGKRD